MKMLSFLTLIFAFLSVVFFLLLIFLRTPFHLCRVIGYQDAIYILTPLVLTPIYWQRHKTVNCERTAPAVEITFMVMAACWPG